MKAFTDTIITKDELMNSECIVKHFLEEKGFTVSITSHEKTNGIDVVAIKKGNRFLIEVKKSIIGTRNIKVSAVGKSGLICDYIAIVTPNNNVIFESMKDHLKLVTKNGERSVTKSVFMADQIYC